MKFKASILIFSLLLVLSCKPKDSKFIIQKHAWGVIDTYYCYSYKVENNRWTLYDKEGKILNDFTTMAFTEAKLLK